MVDKLIQGTKENQTRDESYRTELVNRILESDCWKDLEQEDKKNLISLMTITDLEQSVKNCFT